MRRLCGLIVNVNVNVNIPYSTLIEHAKSGCGERGPSWLGAKVNIRPFFAVIHRSRPLQKCMWKFVSSPQVKTLRKIGPHVLSLPPAPLSYIRGCLSRARKPIPSPGYQHPQHTSPYLPLPSLELHRSGPADAHSSFALCCS